MRKIAIVSHPRTGTTWLHDLLDSHPGVKGFGELLHPSKFRNMSSQKRGHAKVKKLKTSMDKCKDQVFLFKYFYQHIDKRVDTFLIKNGFGIVHMRRNPLDIFISEKLVELNGLNWEGPYKLEKIEIDIQELDRFLVRYAAYSAEATNRFGILDPIGIEYKYLNNQTRGQLRRMASYMQIDEAFGMTAKIKRQRLKDRPETVINYQKVLAHFKDPEWKEYFI